MTARNGSDCDRLHELAPEVALGIADGEDRAWALDHVAICDECRVRVENLAELADGMLMLAPEVEPPAGFDGRVAEALAEARPPTRRPLWRRFAIPAAAAAAAAVVAAAVVWLGLGDDRRLADSYRAALAVAHGQYFDAAPMTAPGGRDIGYVYGYQGRTSWVLAVIYRGVASGDYRLGLVTREGRQIPLRELTIAGGSGSAGSATPVPYDDVAEVRLLDSRGRELAESRVGDERD